jgi:hypothetical protein
VEDPSRRRQWTYAEFIQEAERVARALLAHFQPGILKDQAAQGALLFDQARPTAP